MSPLLPAPGPVEHDVVREDRAEAEELRVERGHDRGEDAGE